MDIILNTIKSVFDGTFSSFIYDDGILLCPENCDVQYILGWLCFVVTVMVVIKKTLSLAPMVQEYIKTRKEMSAIKTAEKTVNHDAERIKALTNDLKLAHAETDEWKEKYARAMATAKRIKLQAITKINKLKESQIEVEIIS